VVSGLLCKTGRLRRVLNAVTMPFACVAAVSLLAACGSSAQSSPGSTADSASASSANVKQAQTDIAAASAEPDFVVPGPAFDISGLKGKTIMNLPSNSTNPFYAAITQGMQQAVDAAGLKMITFNNQGTTSQWRQGMEQAISQKVGAIVLGGINPKSISPQIAAAKKAGIKVIQSHWNAPGATSDPGIDGENYGPYKDVGKLMAEYAIAESKGNVHALIVTDNEYVGSQIINEYLKKTFDEMCGSSCKVSSLDVPGTNWASIQSGVASAITKDPTLNWILPVFDSMTQYVTPAVLAKGAVGKVSVATYNGTPFVLKQIADSQGGKSIVKMDLGENPAAIGWGSIDQSLRLMAGQPVAKDEVTSLRLFDAKNISLTGNPPELGVGYGPNIALKSYTDLWNGAE
jgi:ribose transport system substrate-binding protein